MGMKEITVLAFSIIFLIGTIPAIFAFEFDPLPLVKVSTLPTEADFLEKSKKDLVSDAWHATVVRENGEKIESYFLYSGLRETDVVVIFYFEDRTDDNFKEDYLYKSDLFAMDLVRDTALEVNQKQVEYQKAMLNSMYCSTKKLNTSIKGMNEYREKTSYKENLEEEKKKLEPHMWIFKG